MADPDADGGAGAVAQAIGVAPPAPILPFPPVSPYKWTGAPDATLGKLLTAAASDPANLARLGKKPHMPLSMIALATDGNHRYAGVLDTEMDFSASLLKVAVMYAAFELRAAANRLAAAGGIASQADMVSALPKAFDAVIKRAALPRTRDQPAAGGPRYGEMFAFTDPAPPGGPIDFSATAGATTGFRDAMHAMIVPSDDPMAGQCIRALGYAYLNAVLTKAGFFVPGAMKGDERGIWIAGDYMAAPQQRIHAVNDGTGALVMTTEAMCRLVALLATGQLVDDTAVHGTSNQEMQDLLAEAALGAAPAFHPVDQPFITRQPDAQPFALRPFTLLRGKLGWAHLGRREEGPAVSSECSVLAWKTDAASDPAGAIKQALADHKLTGKLVVCWQNVHDDEVANYDGLADIVTQTYEGLLKSPAP
jgi:hypothetical protein